MSVQNEFDPTSKRSMANRRGQRQGALNLIPSYYESIRVKNQETLIQFLDVELKLASTFTNSALLAYSEGHLEHYEQAKDSAIRAAKAVQRFKSNIDDAKVRNEIDKGLALLKKQMAAL